MKLKVKIRLAIVISVFPLLLFGQKKEGIQWVTNLSWEQVKLRAKIENKFIFLDVYATWCMPCKQMDKKVYSNDTIGDFINKRFIAVKIQADSTLYDDEMVKKWYQDAANIKNNYLVEAFPTYLFFSSDSKPIHKGVGFKNTQDFLQLLKNTLDPEKQYYTVMDKFQSGKMSIDNLKILAKEFKITGKELACKMAADYLKRIDRKELQQSSNIKFMSEFIECEDVKKVAVNYISNIPKADILVKENFELIAMMRKNKDIQDFVLDYLNDLNVIQLGTKDNLSLLTIFKELNEAKSIAKLYFSKLSKERVYRKENITTLRAYTNTSSDKGFDMFFRNSKRIDSVMGVLGFAQQVTDRIIEKEEIKPYFSKAVENDDCNSINWDLITRKLERKYNRTIAKRVILNSQVSICRQLAESRNKNWSEYIKYNIEYIERYGTDTTNGFADALLLNNFSWEAIFFHSTDVVEINKALEWMEGVIRRHPDDFAYIDTYANLLYKVGRKQEAITLESKALEMAKEQNVDYKEYDSVLYKMKNDLPTW